MIKNKDKHNNNIKNINNPNHTVTIHTIILQHKEIKPINNLVDFTSVTHRALVILWLQLWNPPDVRFSHQVDMMWVRGCEEHSTYMSQQINTLEV